MSGRKNILGVLEQMASNAVTVRPSRCAVVRNRNVTCGKCAEACTSGCIHIEEGAIAVDAENCVGCGTCATVCPTCALEAHNPSDSRLLQDCSKAIEDGNVTIVCQQMAAALEGVIETGRMAEVVCLGRVEESLTSGLAVAGANKIYLLCGVCEACRQKHGRATAELVVDTSNELLGAWGSTSTVQLTDEVPSYLLNDKTSKTTADDAVAGFFSQERGAVPVMGEVPEDRDADGGEDEGVHILRVMRDGTLPHFIPDRRERLLDNLSVFGEPGGATVNTRLWGYVVINGLKCTSCRMCATFCPTAAIRKFDYEGGTFGVEHQPIDCVKCGSCRDICPEQAIMVMDDVKANFLIEGQVHHYEMKPRAVELNNAQQIFNTMRQHIDGNMYER